MEPITLTALATLLAPFFTEAGKTLAVESVKLALEKRHDIKDSFLSLFKPEEFISLGLNENQKPEEVKALLAANPDIEARAQAKIESNPDLLKELLRIIKEQAGAESSQITINAKNVGQVINNPTGNVTQNNNWS
jgi:hypothetical protein